MRLWSFDQLWLLDGEAVSSEVCLKLTNCLVMQDCDRQACLLKVN